jgi:ribosomal protein L7/L12
MDELALTRRIRRLEEQVALLSDKLGVPWEEPGSGIPPEIVDLVHRGKKIEAIKAYRELTGVGLAEAKDVIDGV